MNTSELGLVAAVLALVLIAVLFAGTDTRGMSLDTAFIGQSMR